MNPPVGISESKWSGMDTNILSHTQSSLGLYIVAGIPDSAYMEKISNITQILIFYVVISVLAGTALALFFAYRKSRLINGIIDTIQTFTQPVYNTFNNEFDFIRDSFIQIDHSNQAYKRQLMIVKEDIRIYLTQKLLNGQPCSAREKKNFIHYYNIRHPFFVVLILSGLDFELNLTDANAEDDEFDESPKAFPLVLRDAIMRNIHQNHIVCN
ncbi:MAG: hypothetical protein GX028_11745, partial [Clostridiaceae bacterium]|nr:hypothetical protein [Clostridiaceae bacterium]